ncbi:MAG: hypothetical protein O7G85_14160 [Planctomycetota bacterium]|nr:hypothetical protein [Planctomycetota bacterium]
MFFRHATVFLTLTLATNMALGQTRPTSPPANAPGRSSSFDQGARNEKAIETIEDFIVQLNEHNTVKGREESKSYRLLFDAYLDLSDPPYEVSANFNQNTVHNAMDNWSVVSGWVESNSHMRQAILDSKDKLIVGLPYGQENVPPTYQTNGITCHFLRDGKMGRMVFEYFLPLETIATYATAEVYRLMELGQTQDALDLAMAHIFVLRQFCDRDFLGEKMRSIEMLSMALRNVRDVFYVYHDQISLEQYRDISFRELPFLRPDRNRLLMPEADHILSAARLRFVFDDRTGQANPDEFAEAFAKVQSADEPLTRFGAARRWKFISTIHGSLDSSIDRLQLVYDDWWRRWRIEAYDPILSIETEFTRINPIRYAAVLYSMADIEGLFDIRNQLIAEVNGTAMAAGICGYLKSFNNYPRGSEMIYAHSVRKRSDVDPHDFNLSHFRYRVVSGRDAIDTPEGRLWIESGKGLLYSLGKDHEDDRAANHTNNGDSGDVVIWPPIKAMQREQGLLD